MLHLLVLEYTGSPERAEPYAAARADFLERHHREGVFLLSGRAVPAERGGAILVRGVDRTAVERIAAEDPLVAAGVARYGITTVDPGRVHPALAGVLAVDSSRVRG